MGKIDGLKSYINSNPHQLPPPNFRGSSFIGDGGVFPILLEKEKIKAGVVLHIGDINSSYYSIIYGGIDKLTEKSSSPNYKADGKYGGEYMFKILNKTLINKNIVYCDWEDNVTDVSKLITGLFSKAKLKAICGFSKGGKNTWPMVGNSQKIFIGLIDPSIEGGPPQAEKINGVFTNPNAFMLCAKNKNWMNQPSAQRQLGANNWKYSTSSDHFDMPLDFFTIKEGLYIGKV